MSILSDRQIKERLGDTVIIEPFNPANVNTSSYDVTLGECYFIEHKPSFWRRMFGSPVYNIWDFKHVRQVWGEPLEAVPAMWALKSTRRPYSWPGITGDDRVILIPPKHTILAHTNEFIGGRSTVRAQIGSRDPLHVDPSTTMMKARSSFGRNFIEVCKCAGYGDVGYVNRWTMEITNNSRFYSIPLVVGRRIAQIVFMETGETEGRYSDTGKYQSSSDVRDLKADWHPDLMLPRLHLDRDIYRNPRAKSCPHGYADWDECPVCCH